MIAWLLEPWQYAFIQRALVGSMLIGILCALLGVYVVLRRMSNIGHALTHSALPGLVLAYIFKWNLFIGATLATLMAALGIGILSKDDKVYEDTATGMLPTVMFALGIVMISAFRSYRDMSAMLFGNILGISNLDLVVIAIVTVVVIVLLWLFHKEMVLFSVDPDYARTIGIHTSWLRYGLLFLLALATVAGIQAVGTILTNALLITPVAAARLLTKNLKAMMVLAVVFAVSSCVSGVYLSYYGSVSSGASIVLVCAFIFSIAWVYRRVRG